MAKERVLERNSKGDVIFYDEKSLRTKSIKYQQENYCPFKQSNFVQATGASETELLGDVKHDPRRAPEVGIHTSA